MSGVRCPVSGVVTCHTSHVTCHISLPKPYDFHKFSICNEYLLNKNSLIFYVTQSTNTQSTNTQSSNTQSTNTQSTNTQSTNTQSTNTQSTNTQSTNTPIEWWTIFPPVHHLPKADNTQGCVAWAVPHDTALH